MVTDELRTLAEIVAQWADKTPGLRVVYLFGSRVRGDHRPDSDVDLCIFTKDLANDHGTTVWWTGQNDSSFGGLKSKLRARGVRGRLEVHRDPFDEVTAAIDRGEAECVLTVRKVCCMFMPPKAF